MTEPTTESAHSGTCPSDCSPRIVQLLMTPQDATWQNRLLGLGSDGVTYSVSHKGFWEPFVPPLGVTENAGSDGSRASRDTVQ